MSFYKNIMFGIAVGTILGAVLTQECPAVNSAVSKSKDMVKQKIDTMKTKAGM